MTSGTGRMTSDAMLLLGKDRKVKSLKGPASSFEGLMKENERLEENVWSVEDR